MKGMVFGERLRKLREKKYTQEELAEKLNVHSITISKWENGIQAPHSNRISELAQILGTTPAYLLGDTDDPKSNIVAPNNFRAIKDTTQERNTNMAMITLDNGRKAEAPATPEGYAFLERLFMASLGSQAIATA